MVWTFFTNASSTPNNCCRITKPPSAILLFERGKLLSSNPQLRTEILILSTHIDWLILLNTANLRLRSTCRGVLFCLEISPHELPRWKIPSCAGLKHCFKTKKNFVDTTAYALKEHWKLEPSWTTRGIQSFWRLQIATYLSWKCQTRWKRTFPDNWLIFIVIVNRHPLDTVEIPGELVFSWTRLFFISQEPNPVVRRWQQRQERLVCKKKPQREQHIPQLFGQFILFRLDSTEHFTRIDTDVWKQWRTLNESNCGNLSSRYSTSNWKKFWDYSGHLLGSHLGKEK